MSVVAGAVVLFSIATAVTSVIVALSNRGIRDDRLEQLKAYIAERDRAHEQETETCARRVAELQQQVDHQQGQIDVLTGDLGERIGRAVAAEVITRLVDAR